MREDDETEALAVETKTAEIADREELQAMLTRTMRTVQARIDASDPKTPAEERLLIKWIKTQAVLARRIQQLNSDADLDEMAERLELFEEAAELRGDK
ncbi:hypothetical protein [Halorarius litoreus]|uniref:hypothetical protein n=1 Tax=Halorarius litoreus TaxID=2962676 RepID=UPI0020CFBA35|nr:hypothetical protein [Halorarius litoreus]